jgi:hypothetical protein
LLNEKGCVLCKHTLSKADPNRFSRRRRSQVASVFSSPHSSARGGGGGGGGGSGLVRGLKMINEGEKWRRQQNVIVSCEQHKHKENEKMRAKMVSMRLQLGQFDDFPFRRENMSSACEIRLWDGIHQYFYNFSIFFLSFF